MPPGAAIGMKKKMHVYVSVGLLRAKLAGGGQNLRVGEGEGPGDGEGLFPLVTVKDLNLFPWPSMKVVVNCFKSSEKVCVVYPADLLYQTLL